MPATLSILTNVFTDARERALAIGMWSGVAGIGVALGPVTGGFLLEHFWWGSVFIVNVPIAIVAIVAGQLPGADVARSEAPEARPGRARASRSSASSRSWPPSSRRPSNGWTDPVILAGFAVAASAIAAFVWWERRVDDPMLDVRFFRQPAVQRRERER